MREPSRPIRRIIIHATAAAVLVAAAISTAVAGDRTGPLVDTYDSAVRPAAVSVDAGSRGEAPLP